MKQLAYEFEALLMSQMLREMRRSMISDEDDQDQGFGAANMMDTVDRELGAALSRAGGFGLADVLLRRLDRQFPPAVVPRGAGTAAPAVAATAYPRVATEPAAAAGDAATWIAAPRGLVTSAYGWRSDPLNGQVRFHAGTDIALAYGQNVLAAANGRVAFAGEQGGYGLTVVIDHGAGIETRYAHLAECSVHAGDIVQAGQVVARSGNSGRSTGPHLHFEVLKGGQAIDPASVAAGGAFKEPPPVADSTIDRF